MLSGIFAYSIFLSCSSSSAIVSLNNKPVESSTIFSSFSLSKQPSHPAAYPSFC